MEGHPQILMLAVALAAGVFAQSVARHLRVPGIVLLLAAGVVLGPDLLAWVEPRALGTGLFGIVDIAVAVVLFEGGLNLEITRLRRAQTPIRRLVLWGAGVTLVGGTLTVRALLDWPWVQCFLFGSLVVVTGPTVVGPLLRELRLRPRVSTVLEAEGVLIDPIGAILAVLVLEIALAPDTGVITSGVGGLALRLGFGAAAGALAGFVLAGLLRVHRIVPQGFENVFTLASVLLLYQGCDAFISTSGILAVTVAGAVVGNLRTRVDRDLREFKDQLTILLVGLLFILLAADVRLADVQALGWPGIAVVTALVLWVRPLNVALATLGSDLTARERLFIAWVAPRGIVAAAVAALTATAMEMSGMAGGSELRALVFLTIAGTVLLAGLTAGPVARILGIRLPGRDTVAILGAQGLGIALARELREARVRVLLLDSNPHHCRRAEEAGFPVISGNVLDERTLQRARFEQVGTVVGMTPNETLNSLFVSQARELFRVPEAYLALESYSSVTPELVKRHEAKVLFSQPHDVEWWDVRARQGDLEVEHLEFRGEGDSPKSQPEDSSSPVARELYVLFALRRGNQTVPLSAQLKFKKGDVVAAAIHTPEREQALAALRELNWEPQPESDEKPDEPDPPKA
jgi:NhaP-type Na+/H+ or K+/H+ antiporter